MDIENNSSISIPLPKFDGKPKNFSSWWTRYEAYADLYNYSAALQKGGEKDMPNADADPIDDSTSEGKKQAAAKKRNKIAMATLTLAFQTESLMNLIHRAKTTEWPKGKAHLVVEALFEKYQPKDTISLVKAWQELSKVKIKNNENPIKLFKLLGSIENKFNQDGIVVDQADLIATVLFAAPTQYQPVLAVEQAIKGNKLTVEDLEKAMTQYWHQTLCRSRIRRKER